jgi:hypothetical protein
MCRRREGEGGEWREEGEGVGEGMKHGDVECGGMREGEWREGEEWGKR